MVFMIIYVNMNHQSLSMCPEFHILPSLVWSIPWDVSTKVLASGKVFEPIGEEFMRVPEVVMPRKCQGCDVSISTCQQKTDISQVLGMSL